MRFENVENGETKHKHNTNSWLCQNHLYSLTNVVCVRHYNILKQTGFIKYPENEWLDNFNKSLLFFPDISVYMEQLNHMRGPFDLFLDF